MKLLVSKNDIKTIIGLDGYRLFSHQRRKKHIIKLILDSCKPKSTILDVGCASGDIAIELSARGYHVHAIDLESDRLDKGRNLAEKYGQNINFENRRFQDLNDNEAYDLVLLGEVLEHFADPGQILVKIRQLLNSNGRVLITTPNTPSLRNRLKFGLFGIFPDKNPEHKYYFDHKRLSSVVADAGYDLTHFTTNFTNIIQKSEVISYFDSIFFSWFTFLFPKSGDTIFAIISPTDKRVFS